MPFPATAAHGRVLDRVTPGPGGCWLYEGAVTMPTGDSPGGYGKVWSGGKTALAHRVVYEALVGPIPDDRMIDHICNVKRCVRPDHLQVVTHVENMERTRQEFCTNGHDMSVHARQIGNTRRCWVCHLRIARECRLRKAGQSIL